jgi:hypothetical protein
MIYFTDNKGRTIDRYTMVYKHEDAEQNEYWDLFTMSENAMSPQGVNMYSHTLEEEPYMEGNEVMICFPDLPAEVQRAVIARLQSEHDGDEYTECTNCDKRINLDTETFYPYGECEEGTGDYINPDQADEPYCSECADCEVATLKS